MIREMQMIAATAHCDRKLTFYFVSQQRNNRPERNLKRIRPLFRTKEWHLLEKHVDSSRRNLEYSFLMFSVAVYSIVVDLAPIELVALNNVTCCVCFME